MTLPTPDAQSQRSSSLYPHAVSGSHSTPAGFPLPATPPLSSTSSSAGTDLLHVQDSPSTDFSHSWDLATGGLKTLTAKRELPPRQERRVISASLPAPESTRSYMFLLVILACIIVMLISGGVVLFMTLQP